MSYCVELWGNCNKSFLLPIIKAQKMAVRIVCDLKAREHTSTHFKELNILKFPHLVEAKIKVLMFKAWNCKLPDSLQCLFNTKSISRYQTRTPSNFKVKFCKSKIKSNCLSILGVRLWNEVEESMKNCCSLILKKFGKK